MKKLTFIVLVFLSVSLQGQKNYDFRYWEDSLVRLRENVMSAPREEERYFLNEDSWISF